mgnify:CR=1 FL=1|jgi:hypothetical protein
MTDIPKAGTDEWFAYYEDRIFGLGLCMEQDRQELDNANTLWREAIGTSRAPLPLVVDCLYICAKLSGNRVSIKGMKRLTKSLWGKTIEVLPLDRRRNEKRWVWDYKAFILELYPDEAAWDDFTEAWINKVVDESYFKEKDRNPVHEEE